MIESTPNWTNRFRSWKEYNRLASRTTGGSGLGLSEAIRSLEILRVCRQRLQRLARRRFARAKRKDIREPDAPMRANATERQQAHVHPPPHKRAGDSQNAGRVFGRNLRIISKHGHAVAGGKLVKKVGKGW
jgi:hypothetical protein